MKPGFTIERQARIEIEDDLCRNPLSRRIDLRAVGMSAGALHLCAPVVEE